MVERRLRILLVGASGTLGRAVAAELSQRHEVIAAGRNSGALRMDIADVASIRRGLAEAGMRRHQARHQEGHDDVPEGLPFGGAQILRGFFQLAVETHQARAHHDGDEGE